MHADDEALVVARSFDVVSGEYVGVRHNVGPSLPSLPNRLRRSRRQGDQRSCGGYQDILLLGVVLRLRVVWIAQVVHRVDERLVMHLQFLDHLGQRIGGDRIESEVNVKHVEVGVVGTDPARLEHQRRPPPTGYGAAVCWYRIIQSHNAITERIGKMADVDMGSRNRGDAQQ